MFYGPTSQEWSRIWQEWSRMGSNNGVVCAKPEADEAEEDQSVGETFKQYWTDRWDYGLDEAEEDQSVGDSGWANRWLNNLDEAEEDQSVGDSYWANRWLNNLDEAEDEVGTGYFGHRSYSWSDCQERCTGKENKFREINTVCAEVSAGHPSTSMSSIDSQSYSPTLHSRKREKQVRKKKNTVTRKKRKEEEC